MIFQKSIRLLRNYFGYTKQEVVFILFSVPVLLASFGIYKLWQNHVLYKQLTSSLQNTSEDAMLSLSSEITQPKETPNSYIRKERFYAAQNTSSTTLFMFNPNQVSPSLLKKLALPLPVKRNLLKYVEKGGSFRKKEDFRKIYGMNDSLYAIVEPFLQLTKETNPEEIQPSLPSSRLNLNTADSSELRKVNGIGPVLSGRIVKYRNLLGGFVHWKQLEEVYNLAPETIEKIKTHFYIDNNFVPVKLPLREMPLDSLVSHPYLSKKSALLIVRYLEQHSNLTSIDELLHIPGIDTLQLIKIKPYLSFEEKK